MIRMLAIPNSYDQKERILRLSVEGALRRQFPKPDIFPATITSCSSGQKTGLVQSSSAPRTH